MKSTSWLSIFVMLPSLAACGHDDADLSIENSSFPVLAECSEIKKMEIRAQAQGLPGSETSQAELDCSLTLEGTERITKRLIIRTSGVVLNCNGGLIDGGPSNPVNYSPTDENALDMIEVRSTKTSLTPEIWSRPENVTKRIAMLSDLFGFSVWRKTSVRRKSPHCQERSTT